MQIYLSKPVGMKPTYSREMVKLALELHIHPTTLTVKMRELSALETPRIERIWNNYSQNPRKLSRAAKLLREMKGFGRADEFYDGVETAETWEKDWEPIEGHEPLTPVMLILVLDLYFRLTPITMVVETPEVQELAGLMRVPAKLIVEVLQIYQFLDPYLRRQEQPDSALVQPCSHIWERYANIETTQLAEYAEQLSNYFK